MDTESTDYGLVERHRELEYLDGSLIRKGGRIVNIHGAPGTGKTALAMAFGKLHTDKFPGGLFHLRGDRQVLSSLGYSIESTVPSRPEPTLIVVDAMETLDSKDVAQWLGNLLSSHPQASVLVTSRSPLVLRNIDRIGLEAFTSVTTRALIRHLGVDVTVAEAEALHRVTGGNPRTLHHALNMLNDSEYSLADFVEALELAALQPIDSGGIVDASGRPISSGSEYRSIISSITEVSDALLERLARDPGAVYELTPRKFEEVTAELLARQGYKVSLTPFSKDGGKDIYVATNNAIGSFMFLVECKLYAPKYTVGIDLVQRLYGVVQAERATAGIFVTTSSFTAPAKEFQSVIPYQLSLIDFVGIQKWLQLAKRT